MAMPHLHPSTWRLLGLSVGIGYAVFGTIEVLKPRMIAKHLLHIPSQPSEQADRAVSLLVPLLGARDLSIAAVIFWFHHAGRFRESGVVILAGTILCYADAFAVWSSKGLRSGLRMAVGATIWTWIGLGLVISEGKTLAYELA